MQLSAERARHVIAWVWEQRHVASIVAVVFGIICLIPVLSEIDRLGEEPWNGFLQSTNILAKPFGAWTLAYIGSLFIGLIDVFVKIGVALSEETPFIPMVGAFFVAWLFAK
jgi:hypothetical protein